MPRAEPAPEPEPPAGHDAAELVDLTTASPLVWRRTWVEDRPARYGVAGAGLPVLFLHGWGLGHRAYRQSITRLVDLGCRVHAPALPGFAGTADLPSRQFSLAGFARWVDAFLDAVHVDEPAFVVGHSFGGGVAIKLAARFPERVRRLVLVNSIGGSAWKDGPAGVLKSMAERPLWDWGLHFPGDVWPIPQATKVLPVLVSEMLPNAVRNPRAMLRVGNLARRADLTPELEVLKERGLPVVVLWGTRDGVIPRASFDAMCRAIGAEGEVIDGSHSWLVGDPDAFGEVITNHVAVAKLARDLESAAGAAGAGRPGPVRRGKEMLDRLRSA
ncbi:MAG: alpha/beta hydrolase [Actinobacteria bacterium]|nr:alpha/beta hydrolase [Actinomycetota bacterium]